MKKDRGGQSSRVMNVQGRTKDEDGQNPRIMTQGGQSPQMMNKGGRKEVDGQGPILRRNDQFTNKAGGKTDGWRRRWTETRIEQG